MRSALGQMNMRRIRHIHFVGIGGAGMGGIAEVLSNLGYQVSGSDIVDNAVTQRLSQLGVEVNIGHDAATRIISVDCSRVPFDLPLFNISMGFNPREYHYKCNHE